MSGLVTTPVKRDPEDIVKVPRWAVSVAAQFIVEREGQNGELLGVLGGAWKELRKAADSEVPE